jgi:hypothetical protein
VRSPLLSLALLAAVLVCACTSASGRTAIQVYVVTDYPESAVREVRVTVAGAPGQRVLVRDAPMQFVLEPTGELDAKVLVTLRGFDASGSAATATPEQAFNLHFEPQRTTVVVLALSSRCGNDTLDVTGSQPMYTGEASDRAHQPLTVCTDPVPMTDGGMPDASDDGGPLGWAVRAGGAELDEWQHVAADDEGNVFATGTFRSTATVGDSSLVAEPVDGVPLREDAYVAKYDASGSLLWLKQLASTGRVRPHDIALDPDGNPIVVGWFSGSLTLAAGTTLPAPEGEEGFVIALEDAADGSEPIVSWFNTFAGSGRQNVFSIAIGTNGELWVAGDFVAGVVDRDAHCQDTLRSGSFGMFVARLRPESGRCERMRTFAGSGALVGPRMALAPQGRVIATCTYLGSLTVGEGPTAIELPTNSMGTNAFIVQLSPELELDWTRAVGVGGSCTEGLMIPAGLAIDPAGQLLVAGAWRGCLALTGPETSQALISGSPALQPVVLQLTASGDATASPLLAIPGGQAPTGDVELHSLAMNDDGGFVISGGTKSATFDFGLGERALRDGVGKAAWVARYSVTGTPLWIDQFGEEQANVVHSVAFDAEGRILAGGTFHGSAQPAHANRIESAGGQDAFVVRYPH